MNPTFKKLILGFFVVALGVLFWLFIKQILFQNPNTVTEHFWSLGNISIFVALLTLYGTAISLVTFLVGERVWAQSILLCGIASYFLVSPVQGYEFVGAFVVLWAMTVLMREWVAKESSGRIELSVDRALSRNLPWMLTALALAVVVAFYTSPAVRQLKDIRIPREVFQSIIAPLEAPFRQGSAFSVQSFLGTPDNAVPIEGQELSPEEEAQLRRIIRPFSESETPDSPYAQFSDTLYTAVNDRIASIASISETGERILAFSLSITLFVSIRLLAIPVGWAIIILTTVIFNVLAYMGFVKIGTVQVDKEILEL